MKQTMINYAKNGANDEIYTPPYAVEPVLKYIDAGKTVWCPFDTEESWYVELLRKNGNKVIFSHKNKKQNFFNYEPKGQWDIIVSNPPYSVKDKVLERCYSFNKPFALLLPITTLEGVKKGEMFRKYGIQLLVLDKRINFLSYMGKGKNRNWFNASYFCWKLLPKDLMFCKMEKNN